MNLHVLKPLHVTVQTNQKKKLQEYNLYQSLELKPHMQTNSEMKQLSTFLRHHQLL